MLQMIGNVYSKTAPAHKPSLYSLRHLSVYLLADNLQRLADCRTAYRGALLYWTRCLSMEKVESDRKGVKWDLYSYESMCELKDFLNETYD